jgi:hypothetical protein
MRNRVLHWLFTVGLLGVCAVLFGLALVFDAIANARKGSA